MEFGVELMKMFGALAVVLLFLVAALFGVKKVGAWAKKPETNDMIQIVSQRSIGIKHHLVLVKIQESQLLVGISPQGMHLLTPPQAGTPPGVSLDPRALRQAEK